MLLSIDHAAPEPIYLQIRTQVVTAIARGELHPGDRLPSVRALASDLGVNLHTVNKAYALLRDEGYLVMRGRSGARITDPADLHASVGCEVGDERLAASLHQLALEYRARGGTLEEFGHIALQQARQAFEDA
ncbi:MAG: GntR family transcriptional regulator [Eggerthellaceae bacterium]|nr:GntR family transcriptional regulator [Eggerthellaceae bacterium]